MIIEGKNAVAELVKTETRIEKIMIDRKGADNDLIAQIKESGIKYQFVDKAALDRVSVSKRHQGFVAITSEFEYAEIDEIMSRTEGAHTTIVVLDSVMDPHNLANIIRTAECMGVVGVIIPRDRAVGVTETVIRVSAGAANHVPVARVTNIAQTVELLQDNGWFVYAAEATGRAAKMVNLTGKTAIVMGGEDSGVRPLVTKRCDEVISIPMKGKLNSLNVANATAMLLYEINSQVARKLDIDAKK